MTFGDEQADILGGPILQRPDNGLWSIFHRNASFFITGSLLAIGLLAWIYGARFLERHRRNLDLKHKKAMRRQHGIPDGDHRPFAVAYAAAVHARAEREAQERMKTTNHASDHRPAVDHRTAPVDVHGLRRRVPEAVVQQSQGLGKRPSDSRYRRPEVESLKDRYEPHSWRQEIIPPRKSAIANKPPPRRVSRKNLDLTDGFTEENRKRTFADESDVEPETLKKSRIDGEELIDGDEEADWYTQSRDSQPVQRSRTAVESRGTIDYVDTHGRHDHNDPWDDVHEPVDEPMEDVEVDEVSELRSIPRGKKRDRAEAGSTFGGDEEDDSQNKATRHRKRRTVSQRKSEVLSRGKKRNREAESPASEGEGEGSEDSRRRTQHSSRKKRGKKSTSGEAASDESMEDGRISKDPLCGGRRIGDMWEDDGVQYKVGDNGERLRLTLVKKARSKYSMPKDSQHPDRSAALEIYVETWMIEEQYKQAEQHKELVWQELPRTSIEPETSSIPESPTKNGKDLLWDSVKGSPAPRRAFRQSVTPISTRINPFQESQSQPILSRRIASPSTSASPFPHGRPDSPVKSSFRTFSKWEKQDREAEAMAKIRAKLQEQKKSASPLVKGPDLPTSATAPELGAKALTVPTITFTPAPTTPSEVKTASKPSAPSFSFAQPPSTASSTKADTTSTTKPDFSVPTTSAPPAVPVTSIATSASTSSSTVPSFSFAQPSPASTATTTSTTAPSVPSFSFAKPQQPPSAPDASTSAPSSSSIPDFFAKPSISTSTPTSSFTFWGTSQGQTSAGASTAPSASAAPASKQPTFSFAQPSAPLPSSSASLASTDKPSASIFGASSVGASSAASGSTTTPGAALAPATSKTDPTTSSTLATTAPADTSKPTGPIFSFGGGPSATPTTSSTTLSSTPSVPKLSFTGGPSATPTSSTMPPSIPSMPKFSFGQPSTTSTYTPSAPISATTTKPKPSFTFGGTPTASTDAILPSAAGDEAKNATAPVPIFGSTTAMKDANKPAFAPTSTSDTKNDTSKPATGFAPTSVFGSVTSTKEDTSKPVTSAFMPTSVSVPKDETAKPSTSAFSTGTSVFGGGSAFGSSSEFGKTSTPATTGSVGSSATWMPGPTATPSNTLNLFSTTPATSFASGSGTGPTSAFNFGGNAVSNTKPTETTPQPATSAFGSAFTLGSNSASSSKPAEISQPTTSAFGSTSFGVNGSTFAFGKKDDASSTNAPSKPPAFLFGAPSSSTMSVFGQPSTMPASSSGTSGSTTDATTPTPSIFGKPSGTTSTFNFGGAGSGTFNFRAGSGQNQKQEQ